MVHRLLIAVASLVAEHGLSTCCGLQQLQHAGSLAAVHALSCSTVCGIIPDQGLNLYPLQWQVDSYPLTTREVPEVLILKIILVFKVSFSWRLKVVLSKDIVNLASNSCQDPR